MEKKEKNSLEKFGDLIFNTIDRLRERSTREIFQTEEFEKLPEDQKKRINTLIDNTANALWDLGEALYGIGPIKSKMTEEDFLRLLNIVEVNQCCDTLTSIDELANEDYEMIEFVYMHHPKISHITGKSEMATLYYMGGMGFISHMYKEAQTAFEVKKKIVELQRRIEKEKETIEYIASKYDKWNLV